MQHTASAFAPAQTAQHGQESWPQGSPLVADTPDLSTDWLGGVASARRLVEYLEELLETRREAVPVLVLIDIDRFHTLDAQLGLLVHDRLLCRVAQRLRAAVPQALLVARVAGETFALVMETADAEAQTRLIDLLGRCYAVSGHVISLGACIATTPAPPGTDAEDWLHTALAALQAARLQRPAEIHPFEPSLYERTRIRQALEGDLQVAMLQQQMALRRGLVGQQFELHYQPQIRLSDGRLIGFEALLRWRHPVRGLLGPAAFLPLAEEIGLAEPLGEWVLRTACRDAAGWAMAVGAPDLRVSVNLSPAQLRAGAALVGTVDRALHESGLDPGRLELELTEAAVADEPCDTLVSLHHMGVDLALDNFGTGTASLGRLRAHPFSRFKIDRCFVADFGKDGDSSGQRAGEWMIRGFAALGVGLGLETVVEGIETLEQRAVAMRAGCTAMQGFLISRAVPNAALPELIRRLDPARSKEAVGHGL
jgi:diguanylate cyclase (GGDEF)-like protein